MLVQFTFGRDNGRVVDVLPHEAHAMIADGRACWPEGSPFAPARVATDVAVVSAQVNARSDRGMPRTKHRRTR